MATRTISSAGGNYNTDAAWVEGAVPTASDDVVATSTSGSLTVNVASACRSFDLTNYTATLTINSGETLTIGTTTAQGSNVALSFPTSGWTLSLGSTLTSAIAFSSTVASTTQTIDFGGHSIGKVTFSAATTSSYQFINNNFTAQGAFTHTQGGLEFNGLSVTVIGAAFTSTGTNTRTLDLTNASVYIQTTGSWTISGSNLTFTVTGSTIYFQPLSGNVTASLGGQTYNNITVNGTTGGHTANLGGDSTNNTFNNLTLDGTSGTSSHRITWTAGTTQTITGTLTLNGNSTSNATMITNTAGTRTTLNVAAANSPSYIGITDIAITGAAMPINMYTNTNTDSGDNSGFQFNANYAIIQATVGAGGTASTATSGTLNVAAGHCLVAVITENATGNTWTVSDALTGNNSWQQAVTETNTNQRVDIWYAIDCNAYTGEQVIVTSTGVTTDMGIVLYDLLNADLTSPLDKTTKGATTGTNPTTGATGTLSQADEMFVFGVISADTTLSHFSHGGGWTLTPVVFSVTANTQGSQVKTVAATTTTTPSMADATSAAYACVVATFKYTAPVAGGATPVQSSMMIMGSGI